MLPAVAFGLDSAAQLHQGVKEARFPWNRCQELHCHERATWVNLAREWPGTLPPSSKPGRVGGLDPCYPRSHPAGGGGLEVGYMRVAPISASSYGLSLRAEPHGV
ncbi:unnamed protein product [Rangifer tarandus platyrhynchus]|uniref:Uncharacterized protein n=1 Tax=Rangifer tarandus platyrhynchus TaxID=3082113 RepID=A0AC59ZVG0_RANTA